MRFVSITVNNFQALESAKIDFAPGLNVVFGPNDLGKSTVARAIRAALLVQPSSTEADQYIPWSVDAVPEVTLTFQDDDDRYWRVRKSFGAASSQCTADLYHSKDGSTFSRECGGREVEDELRKRLAWGIPSPGGKGAPRKLPRSFLSHTLLAEQTQVETIFEQSLEGDGTESGKDRLRKALAALAEDPHFKTILIEVQTNVATYFSPTGQRKKGRGSPFAHAVDAIGDRNVRVEELRRKVSESESTEELLRQLREAYSSAREAHEEATTTLQTVRDRWARSERRARAQAEYASAVAALEDLDRQADEVAEHERALKGLEAEVVAAESTNVEATKRLETADAEVRVLEDALRAATSAEGAHQRELSRARLGAERAELVAQVAQAQKRLETLEAAQTADEAAAKAVTGNVEAQLDVSKTLETEASARTEFSEAERELEFTRGLLTYGQWRAACEARTQEEEAKATANSLRTEVAATEQTAQSCESQAGEKIAEAEAMRKTLPDPALTARIEQLSRDLEIAEAALGGGFSITIRGSGKVPIHASLDGRAAVAGTQIEGRFVLEADRTATLRAGDLLDIEIVAGAADKRRALEALRDRWTQEGAPILNRAHVGTLAGLRDRLSEATTLEATADGLRRDAKQKRTDAEGARQRAEIQERLAAEMLVRANEAGALESKFASLDVQHLAAKFAELGPAWKQETEDSLVRKEQALSLTRDKLSAAKGEHELAIYRADEAAQRAESARLESIRQQSALELPDSGANPDLLSASIRNTTEELTTLSTRQTEIADDLRALEDASNSVVVAAQAAVETAIAAREHASAQQASAARALEEARPKYHKAAGQTEILRDALATVDRAGAETRLAAAATALEQYAQDAAMPAEAVQEAEKHESDARTKLDHVRRDLDHADGALTKVGGEPTREELRREEEALDLAKEWQRNLELEADSWKLLRETLQEAEKDGNSHLGRSLAAAVSERLVRLTQARYGGLRLDQHLKAEALDVPAVPNAENVLGALSVGTRDQIATLLRLTIAEQLKSAIILDDHLVHTDPDRLAWFRDALRDVASKTQVIVITCRPEDYLGPTDLSGECAVKDFEGEAIRAINFMQIVRRFAFSTTQVVPQVPDPLSHGERAT